MKLKQLCFFVFYIALSVNAQDLGVQSLNYRHYFSQANFNQKLNPHTGVKPFYLLNNTKKDTLKVWEINNENNLEKKISLELYPILNINVGYELPKHEILDLGLGLGMNIKGKKWLISSKILPYYTRGNSIYDSIYNAIKIDVGAGRSIAQSTFFNSELIGLFRPNHHFAFLGGIGKNTFGEGYRSLLLSDNAASNPFVKMEIDFWRIKYVSLFNVWNDFHAKPTDRSKDVTKLSAMHYLSWNINKQFNFSVFETVIWQAKDSLTTRYFEPNYMNPFVMYRPVEYAQGSADNVLLGINLSFKPNETISLYYQLILDEFLLKEIKAKNQWWANKFGMQIGVKSADFIISNLYAQVEFNMVRPFTYSHKQSPQNYGHASSSVTHPLGANFYELLGVFSYQYKKQQFTCKINYSGYGVDSSAVNYGQNIFESYSNRDGNDNHIIMQGEKHNVLNTELIYEYPIKRLKNTFLTGRFNWRMISVSNSLNHTQSFEIGLKTRIWNQYHDF